MLDHPAISKAASRVVITEKDFIEYGDPIENSKKNLKTLFKIHGSVRNVLTGEMTQNSIITTFSDNKKIDKCSKENRA